MKEFDSFSELRDRNEVKTRRFRPDTNPFKQSGFNHHSTTLDHWITGSLWNLFPLGVDHYICAMISNSDVLMIATAVLWHSTLKWQLRADYTAH